jgi:hypothetical protein
VKIDIRTSHDRPPIPTRAADWSAYDHETYDGAEDSGQLAHMVGYGATDQEAIADYLEQRAVYEAERGMSQVHEED